MIIIKSLAIHILKVFKKNSYLLKHVSLLKNFLLQIHVKKYFIKKKFLIILMVKIGLLMIHISKIISLTENCSDD